MKMPGRVMVLILIMVLAGGSVSAKREADEFVPKKKLWPLTGMPANWNYNTMIPLLKNGEMNMVYSNEDGSFKQTTVFCLIDAPAVKVWPHLIDFENFPQYMPKVASMKQLKQAGDDFWYLYELDLPGPDLSFPIRIHMNSDHTVDYINEEYKGDSFPGGWRYELHPVENGSKTILVYKAYFNVRDRSWLIRRTLSYDATMAHPLNIGVNTSIGTLYLKAIKKRSETSK